jgi:hypothetical protein
MPDGALDAHVRAVSRLTGRSALTALAEVVWRQHECTVPGTRTCPFKT